MHSVTIVGVVDTVSPAEIRVFAKAVNEYDCEAFSVDVSRLSAATKRCLRVGAMVAVTATIRGGSDDETRVAAVFARVIR